MKIIISVGTITQIPTLPSLHSMSSSLLEIGLVSTSLLEGQTNKAVDKNKMHLAPGAH